MPTIYLPPKKQYKRKQETNKQDNVNHKAVYNTKRWKSIRIEKLKRDPLCEICLKKGIIKSGIDVHHIIPISSGKTIADKQRLGFSLDNILTLCKECHKDIHDDKNWKKNLFNPKPGSGSKRTDWF